MKTPSRIEPLVIDGLVDHVHRQLMSGKEAMVYVVQCGEEVRCAKVYKEANKRGFHKAVDYTEGRKIKNSRQARAMAKGSRYGRQEQEATVWTRVGGVDTGGGHDRARHRSHDARQVTSGVPLGDDGDGLAGDDGFFVVGVSDEAHRLRHELARDGDDVAWAQVLALVA